MRFLHLARMRAPRGAHVLRAITLEKGELIEPKALSNDLNWINRNPFLRADAMIVPGIEERTSDIEIMARMRRPYRVYYGWDDYGSPSLDSVRQFLGFNVGHYKPWTGILSFQYTTTHNFKQLHAYTGSYEVFFPWRHILQLYGGYANISDHNLYESFKSEGYSLQTSIDYTVPLPFLNNYSQDIYFGTDYKQTNNNVLFALIPVLGSTTRLTQWFVGYRLEFERHLFNLTSDLRLVFSPFKFLPNQTNSDYDQLREGAKPKYVYFDAHFDINVRLPRNICYYFNLQGQLSSANLLPSESFFLGGAYSVRGYEERIVQGDYGFFMNSELRFPSFSFFRKCKGCLDKCSDCRTKMSQACCGPLKDIFTNFIFFDYGITLPRHRIQDQPDSYQLMGIGTGIRYTLDPYLALKLDWGIRLFKLPDIETNWQRVHFSAVLSY